MQPDDSAILHELRATVARIEGHLEATLSAHNARFNVFERDMDRLAERTDANENAIAELKSEVRDIRGSAVTLKMLWGIIVGLLGVVALVAQLAGYFADHPLFH